MDKRICIVLSALLLLAGCGRNSESGTATAISTSDLRQAPDGMSPSADKAGAGSAVPDANIPVSMPRIAYVYEYGYRIAAAKIPALARKHADLCEKQGPQVCRLIAMRQSGTEGEYARAHLNLEVAAPRARAFGAELAKTAGEAGGDGVSSSIMGEDLSKQIVDTQARLRARTVLRDRLMEVLASRKGTVAELVEAERGVAQVNEEIDEAQSWLAEMKGRVEFSKVNISYASGSRTGGAFFAPIRAVFGSLGMILGTTIAALIGLAAVMAPLAAIFWGLRKLWLRLRKTPELEAE